VGKQNAHDPGVNGDEFIKRSGAFAKQSGVSVCALVVAGLKYAACTL